jgi:hypothetical protein
MAFEPRIDGKPGQAISNLQDRVKITEKFPPYGKHKVGIEFVSGVTQKVYHGLGRRPLGYMVTKTVSSGSEIYEPSDDVSIEPHNYLNMKTGTSGTWDIWFF